jgi:fatty-acid desaturase
MSHLTFGATLHHNHQAFPRVLSPAIDKEFDPMKLLYRVMQKLGVIVMLPDPTAHEIEEKRIRPKTA